MVAQFAVVVFGELEEDLALGADAVRGVESVVSVGNLGAFQEAAEATDPVLADLGGDFLVLAGPVSWRWGGRRTPAQGRDGEPSAVGS